MTFLVAPPPPPPPPPPPAAAPVHVIKKIETDLNNGQLRTPTAIPKKIAMIKEDEPPPAMGAALSAESRAAYRAVRSGGVIGGIISSTPVAVPKVATPQKVRVSQGVSEGLLLHKITPSLSAARKTGAYSGFGRAAGYHWQGRQPSKTFGSVQGHPMLTQSAIGRGEAVEVQAVPAEW